MEKKINLERPLASLWVGTVDGMLKASMVRGEYYPVTSFKTLNELLKVEEVHPFETGEFDEWTRYYRDQQDYDIEIVSGISYHLDNQGKKYDLIEYFNQMDRRNQTPEIWLIPEKGNGTGLNDEIIFCDTLVKVVTSIYQGNEMKVPELPGLIG